VSLRLKRGDEAVVHRFATAWSVGRVGALRGMLTSDAFLVCDGGGKVEAALDPARGADAVARCVTELLSPGAAVSVEAVNGQAGVVLRRAGSVVAVVSLKVTGTKVAGAWIVLNPDKLRHWR
jgi:hypothetical protein